MPKAPRIFVVEDDESIRMLLEVALRSSGYTVSAFPNAADALAEMENTVPDAAVLDIMLDGMDGITALKLMRANARLAGVPVMMLTAKDSENDKIIGLDAGADDYMTKPFSVLELCARVRALLRRGGAAPAPKKGGVLKKGQVGLLEGKGAEAVVPLERNTQWISKVAAMMVQMLGSSGQAVNVTIPVYVGGKHLSTVVLDDVNQTEKKGRDPVTAAA